MDFLPLAERPALGIATLAILLLSVYLFRLNQVLGGTPNEVRKLAPQRWTRTDLLETYERLEKRPFTTGNYAQQIPPKLERRYIITGGSGLVGGYLVLQLLQRGQPPSSIRIVDFKHLSRQDMLDESSQARDCDFVQTDISSASSAKQAFAKPWPSSVAHLPLTVFHTAAVIVPSDRSKLEYAFCEAVNVRGTQNVVDAARRAGADVFVSTTSASISIQPVDFWVAPWKLFSWSRFARPWPRNFRQVLDEADFDKPLRKHEEFYANYPASKAAGERIVCGANAKGFRTGSIRPANGVYGNPTSNTVGGPLNMGVCPTWTAHIVQSFIHGINVAIAHLHLEAILASSPDSHLAPQAGRPFVVTDPNPPTTYGDLYFALKTLAVTPFRTFSLPPLPLLLASYPIEWYSLLLTKYPILRRALPSLKGDVKHLKPGLFSICTHLVATNDSASRSVENGGLGYKGVLTTMEGMAQEVMEWNEWHRQDTITGVASSEAGKRPYQSSVSLADEIHAAAAWCRPDAEIEADSPRSRSKASF